jgi:PTS system mannose-specific IIA component
MTDPKPQSPPPAAPDAPAPPPPLIGVVVVTHGLLATELVNAAEMIAGDLPQFAAVSIGWHDDVEAAKEAIAAAIARVSRDAGVIMLTDMFGGTPSNLGMTFLEKNQVEVITGVNLPMLIKLTSLRQSSNLMEVARSIREAGREAIWVASDVMRADAKAKAESSKAEGGR